MGPTNVALVNLFRIDQDLREAQERYDTAARSVRILERRVAELSTKVQATHQSLKEQQTKAASFELDIKTRDEKIEKLRTQQQTARTNKEYQAFLTEINTEKVDRNKSEDEALKAMEAVERIQAELKIQQTQFDEESKKLADLKAAQGGRLADLQAEIDRIKPARQEAWEAVPPRGRTSYERIADKHEGDAMSPMQKPDARVEEYSCGTCNMSLVVDVYNRLHSRDELVPCPNCGRLLFIPAELPPEVAVHKAKEKKEPRAKGGGAGASGAGAAMTRQTAAKSVVESVNKEPEEAPAATVAGDGSGETADAG